MSERTRDISLRVPDGRSRYGPANRGARWRASGSGAVPAAAGGGRAGEMRHHRCEQKIAHARQRRSTRRRFRVDRRERAPSASRGRRACRRDTSGAGRVTAGDRTRTPWPGFVDRGVYCDASNSLHDAGRQDSAPVRPSRPRAGQHEAPHVRRCRWSWRPRARRRCSCRGAARDDRRSSDSLARRSFASFGPAADAPCVEVILSGPNTSIGQVPVVRQTAQPFDHQSRKRVVVVGVAGRAPGRYTCSGVYRRR